MSEINCCIICAEELDDKNTCKIKCGHDCCTKCMDEWTKHSFKNMPKKYILNFDSLEAYVKCPMCKREYVKTFYDRLLQTTSHFTLKSIICKCVFKNGYIKTLIEPMQIYSLTTKSDLQKINNIYYLNLSWHTKIRIIVNLLITKYESDKYLEPLFLYVYKDGLQKIKLSTALPEDDDKLIDARFFYDNLNQSIDIVDNFIDILNGDAKGTVMDMELLQNQK